MFMHMGTNSHTDPSCESLVVKDNRGRYLLQTVLILCDGVLGDGVLNIFFVLGDVILGVSVLYTVLVLVDDVLGNGLLNTVLVRGEGLLITVLILGGDGVLGDGVPNIFVLSDSVLGNFVVGDGVLYTVLVLGDGTQAQTEESEAKSQHPALKMPSMIF